MANCSRLQMTPVSAAPNHTSPQVTCACGRYLNNSANIKVSTTMFTSTCATAHNEEPPGNPARKFPMAAKTALTIIDTSNKNATASTSEREENVMRINSIGPPRPCDSTAQK